MIPALQQRPACYCRRLHVLPSPACYCRHGCRHGPLPRLQKAARSPSGRCIAEYAAACAVDRMTRAPWHFGARDAGDVGPLNSSCFAEPPRASIDANRAAVPPASRDNEGLGAVIAERLGAVIASSETKSYCMAACRVRLGNHPVTDARPILSGGLVGTKHGARRSKISALPACPKCCVRPRTSSASSCRQRPSSPWAADRH